MIIPLSSGTSSGSVGLKVKCTSALSSGDPIDSHNFANFQLICKKNMEVKLFKLREWDSLTSSYTAYDEVTSPEIDAMWTQTFSR